MQFGILGPLKVLHGGQPVLLGGLRQRAVLARLLVDLGRVVPADRLIEDVWDGRPPASARKTLQKYVSELRRALPAPVLRTAEGGYSLEVDDEAIDARRFEGLVAAGDPAAALALWRGDVLADLGDLGFVVPERARLDELRLIAIEARIARDLDEGRHAESVGELADLAATHPLHERFTALHVLALYRSGRQVEALRVLARHRRILAEDVGLEPALELQELETAILQQDPSIASPRLLPRPSPGKPEASPVARPGNLPLPLTSFVGRGVDIAATCSAMRAHRLVTLTGPGGVGKTRLALEVARSQADQFPGGVWLADLSGVGSPDLVVDAVASVLAVDGSDGNDPLGVLLAVLAGRPGALVVLDNCEHVVEACAAMLDAVLRATPDLGVLSTSRRPLGVDGEFIRPVAPLGVDDAVQLFAERARLAGTELAGDEAALRAATEICLRIDGLPLGIELVASQLRVLDAGAIAARVQDHLQFRGPATAAPRRQRTLRDMVEWSHELIPPATQQVFASLGVFASSLTLEAAEAVCGVPRPYDHVATLVDHSLLSREPGTIPVRYRLLETLRLFALEKLDERGGSSHAFAAHAAYVLQFAQEAGPKLYGPEEGTWRARMEAEEPNLHAALRWTADHDPSRSLELSVALWPYWDVRWSELHGVAHLAGLLDLPDAGIDEHLRAWGLTAAAELAANPGDARRSVPWAAEAVATFRRIGDEQGLARALFASGLALGNAGRLDEADAALLEGMALARRFGDDVVVARALNAASYLATRRGELAVAVRLCHEEVEAWRRIGSRRGEATALRHLAVANQYVGDLDQSEGLCRRALTMWEELGDLASVAHVRLTLADLARLRGDASAASAQYDDALATFVAIGDRRCTASTFKNQALLAGAIGEDARSAELFRRAIALRHDLGDDAGLAECLEGLAAVLVRDRRADHAMTLLAAAASIRSTTGALAVGAVGLEEALLERARRDIGESGVVEALARGRQLAVPEVVAMALDQP